MLSTLIWLITGLIAGVLAMFVVFRAMPRKPISLIGALLVGLIGGGVGGWITNLVGLRSVNWLGAIVVAFVGSFLILKLVGRMAPGEN